MAASASVMAGRAQVTYQDRVHPLLPGEVVEFGRVAGVVLDPSDVGISRRHLRFWLANDAVWVRNLGRRAAAVIDADGFRSTLGSQADAALTRTPAQVVLTTPVRGYAITVEHRGPPRGDAGPDLTGGLTDIVVDHVTLSPADKDVLGALCSPLVLPFPRSGHDPLLFREGAEILGVTEVSVRKRVEHIRERYEAAGITVDGPNKFAELARLLVAQRIIVRADAERVHAAKRRRDDEKRRSGG